MWLSDLSGGEKKMKQLYSNVHGDVKHLLLSFLTTGILKDPVVLDRITVAEDCGSPMIACIEDRPLHVSPAANSGSFISAIVALIEASLEPQLS